MKRKKIKAAISVFLTILMLTTLAGCKKDNKEASGEDTTTAEVLGYPITKEPITLKYWIPIHALATQFIRSYAENEVYQEMEKITGIKIEFIHPANGQEDEQFNLMIASGDIPDLITGAARYKGGITMGVEDEVYLDLTPYAQKYAPDYYKLINSNPEIKREATFDDGKVFAFYRIKPKVDVPFRRLVTRKDWLDEAGVTEPKTLADWETYLKLLKDKNKGDAPFILTTNGMEGIIMGAYNILPGFYLKDAKNVAYGQIQPQFKEYLTLMNKWFTSGLISKDFPSLKEAQSITQFSSGKTGVLAASVDQTFNNAKANNYQLVTTPFPRIKLGDKLHWNNSEWFVGGDETVINKDTKYKTEAVRWLNYAYSEEGAMLFNFGIKDSSYVMENGKPKYTDKILKNPKIPAPVTNYLFRMHFAPKLTFSDLECVPGVLANGQESINNRLKWSDDKDVDNTYVIPPIRLTVDESSSRARLMTEVDTYVNEMVLKFIIGAEPLSKFDEYVNNVKKLGIDEAAQITQKAYERYMK
ncbi:MAG: extracellular solute-binding protein family 1 [Clostridiales bacterium]|nr:extracellular solute-binding protein family 1 [Clostridiales bacterium]